MVATGAEASDKAFWSGLDRVGPANHDTPLDAVHDDDG